jgi:deoxyuridine 5'-triphosphate nucleotidohydrolase
MHIQKVHPNAEELYKERPSDVGWDVTLIARGGERTADTVGDVNDYETGLCVAPPPGYYVEIVARSSLQKHGYMLANNIGIIDPEYRGLIKVQLYKFKESKDLSLPGRYVQLILRPAMYCPVDYHQVDVADQKTSRGAAGFGSTGNRPPSGRSGRLPQADDDESEGQDDDEVPAYKGRYGKAANPTTSATSRRRQSRTGEFPAGGRNRGLDFS